MTPSGQTVSGPLTVTITNLRRSWDFNPRAVGARAVRRHADALRRLSDR